MFFQGEQFLLDRNVKREINSMKDLLWSFVLSRVVVMVLCDDFFEHESRDEAGRDVILVGIHRVSSTW